ncbi:MAG: hypothetical protein AMJ56_11815 [Anaerolineae bacterium SG8_19]|jgi:uncharacterized membrane protein|nr:MAG: hypothetical protein AMJ56_11815 [Anaerolineae bacterium SG8_19]
MTTITGYSFDTAEGAEKMVDLVQDLSRQQLITLEDAAIVTWPQGKKKPKTKHLGDLTGEGALGGAFWGMLFGLIFFVPFFGMAVGAAMGALAGHYSNYGIDKDFIEQAQDKVTEGTSALFLMTSQAVQDKVTDAIKKSGLKFDLFYTNLSEEQEKQLQEDFAS